VTFQRVLGFEVDIPLDPHESDDGAVVCRHSGGTRHGRSKAVVADRVSRRRDLLRFDGVVDLCWAASWTISATGSTTASYY